VLYTFAGRIVTRCNEASNILVGANSGLDNTSGAGVTFHNGAEARTVCIVHGAGLENGHASLSFHARVVEGACVSNGAGQRRVLAWVCTSGHRRVTIVRSARESIIANGGVGDEHALRTVGVGGTVHDVGGARVAVVAY